MQGPIKSKYIGPIEIVAPNGETLYTEVVQQEGKLITGTACNVGLLRDQWEISIEEYGSVHEAYEALYEMLEEYAFSEEGQKEL